MKSLAYARFPAWHERILRAGRWWLVPQAEGVGSHREMSVAVADPDEESADFPGEIINRENKFDTGFMVDTLRLPPLTQELEKPPGKQRESRWKPVQIDNSIAAEEEERGPPARVDAKPCPAMDRHA